MRFVDADNEDSTYKEPVLSSMSVNTERLQTRQNTLSLGLLLTIDEAVDSVCFADLKSAKVSLLMQ